MIWKSVKKGQLIIQYSCKSKNCDWGEWEAQSNDESFDSFHMCPWCSNELSTKTPVGDISHLDSELKKAA